MRRAYLTVYLSLTLAIMLSLVLGLIEGTRANATRLKALCAVDVGINSTLSEYNKELLEQYDLLFLDMSYCSGGGNIDTVKNHLNFYLRMNMDEADTDLARDLVGLRLQDLTIEEYALATDNMAEALRNQVSDYMKTTLKGALISGFDDISAPLSSANYSYNYEGRRSENQAEIDSIELPKVENEEGELVEVALNNPADIANATRGGGVLANTSIDVSQISNKKVNTCDYASNRSLNRANGISEEERKLTDPANSLLYSEYLFDKCAYWGKEKETSCLDYQIEYIIKGEASDWENLEAICTTLLLWREAINFVYVLSDSGKVAQAEAVAAVLAAVMLNPEFMEPVKISILLAWAYVESLQDIRILLDGDGVPVAKTDASWHTHITDLLNPKGAMKSYSGQSGAKYGDYLKTMLLMTPFENVVFRSIDVMEMDVRMTRGNSAFKMDQCMQSFLVNVNTTSTHGHLAHVRRRSGYYYS